MPKARLIDVSKCQACRGCQVACKQWNELPAEHTTQRGTYENPPELSGRTWIKVEFRERPGEWLFRPHTCMHCTDASCEKVCPTGAIASLPLSKKRETVIGIARIDQERCIPWAEGRECIVCEEMCPIPQKAIHLNGQGRGYRGGQTASVHLPRVREHLCTGCGICEYQCPVDGESAIRVFPIK